MRKAKFQRLLLEGLWGARCGTEVQQLATQRLLREGFGDHPINICECCGRSDTKQSVGTEGKLLTASAAECLWEALFVCADTQPLAAQRLLREGWGGDATAICGCSHVLTPSIRVETQLPVRDPYGR